ncbi:MAG: acyltransferase [Solirubrobacterales bacterium]
MVAEHKRVAAYRPWNFIVNVLGGSSMILPSFRRRLYRWGGLDIATSGVRPGCIFLTSQIRIGPETTVEHRCYFENREPVEIGARCSLAAEVSIATSSHVIGPSSRRAGAHNGAPVAIGDGSWIGARVTILAGVTIAEGCVVAAGAVVTGDCLPNGLYAGVPARRVRDLDGERAELVVAAPRVSR